MQITEPEITKYAAYRQAQAKRVTPAGEIPSVNSSINRETQILLKALRLAHRARLLVHVPHVDLLKERPARSGFVTLDTFEAIRKRLPADVQVIAVLGHTYGMRHDEILSLDWDRHIDFETKQIILHHGETKTDAPRTLKMTAEVEVLLHEQRARIRAQLGHMVDYVFPVLPGPRAGAALGTRRRGFRRAWLNATKGAGVPGLRFHDLRRSAVRNLVRAGVPEKVAMTVSGHKNASVFSRYNIVSKEDQHDATSKLEQFYRNGGAA